ncbi:MAG: response regulator [Alphaproteobacteria bacterium]|uniref:histidine kinase n=1 Tax=Brevundimonas mediterranea TaxID=74329 RepID=A0AB37ECF5_9CAUL|nr:two-component system sensor histidine kinase/response regulator [Brevundimonas sp.]MBU1270746.1 response regulator [Alphaproteobacteria bacterium]QIH74645.1 response regulator [Brevundimonas mediterranea]MBU1522516.1 response regulator [Alphaproteobacteria bacterium]MBU2032057.1 response regulator [Alphaproteobacteria bacterium]
MSGAIRLLYIDDDRGLSRLVEKELSRHGFAVTCAPDGDAGLALLAAHEYDVCALDHYMPSRDGLDVLPDILTLNAPPPVVYVTGAQEGRIAVAALRAGAADYVIKDVSEDFTSLLRSALEDAVLRRRLQRENDIAQEEVRLARDRAEAMLREVNHRVGNSLQLVSSFMSLQMRQITDEGAREALRECQARIEAVAHVHRRLYTSGDMSRVAMDEYLEGLMHELSKSVGPGEGSPRLVVDAAPMWVTTDQAVSLGVVVAELVTNAVKYAYLPGQGGEIRIKLQPEGEHRAILTVEDDGPGLGDGAPKGTGLGGKIISAMASGLRSAVEFDAAHKGVRARLAFDL